MTTMMKCTKKAVTMLAMILKTIDKGMVMFCKPDKLFVWIIMFATMTSFVRSMSIGPMRYEDESFPEKNIIHNHTVTCGKIKQGRFIAPTFTCSDLKVDGHRLAYGYYAGWAIGMGEHRCQETSGVHEFGHLCMAMLQSINKERLGFRAVYVPNSTCGYMNETRKLLKKVARDRFEWQDFNPGWGWTDTIQCMTAYL